MLLKPDQQMTTNSDEDQALPNKSRGSVKAEAEATFIEITNADKVYKPTSVLFFLTTDVH